MEPNHLKSCELTYEIKIRNVEPTGDVDKRRRILRGILNQENANRSFSQGIFSNPYSYDDDVKEIKNTISDLKNLIVDFSGNISDPVVKRISSRLTHLSGRLQRIKVENEEQEALKKDLQYEVLDLEGEWAFKLMPPSSTPTVVAPPVNQTVAKFVPPYKWNVCFTGSTQKESVNSFLEKIELLREARGVSKADLFASACDLFKGQAWSWFVNNKNKVQNWDELVRKLKEDFLPYHYEDDLWQEINSRTQGANERVAIFVSAMENLFNRLSSKPDERTIVNKIRRNLLPCYITGLALHEPNTVSELLSLCKKLEESQAWSVRFAPPPNRRTGLLEPDLSCPYVEPGFSNKKSNFSRPSNISNNISTVSALRCWNCSLTGHSYSRCNKPKTFFCYGCGRKNTIKSKCPTCSPKNSEQGGVNLDDVTSAQSPDPKPSTSRNSTGKAKPGVKGKKP